MAAKAFGWMGETRRRAVAAKAGALVQAWWDAWSLAPAQVALDGGADIVPDGVCRQADGRGIAFCVDGDLLAALTLRDAHAGGELAAHLERSALLDLARRLTGAEVLDDASLHAVEAVPDTLADPRFGGCALVLGLGGLRLRLWLDRRAAAAWVPLRAAKPVALVARSEAVAPASARLRASLDLGEITLDELQGLAPGDVIATLAPLTRPLDLTLAGAGRSLFQGQLGERDGHRALRLSPTEHEESMP